MRKEMIGRYQVERLVKKELIICDTNSTGNYIVYCDYDNYMYCFSYDALIVILTPNGVPMFTWCAVGYSNTTSRHTYKFMEENVNNYYSVKWLKEMIEDNLGYSYEFEISNINELKYCLEINSKMLDIIY